MVMLSLDKSDQQPSEAVFRMQGIVSSLRLNAVRDALVDRNTSQSSLMLSHISLQLTMLLGGKRFTPAVLGPSISLVGYESPSFVDGVGNLYRISEEFARHYPEGAYLGWKPQMQDGCAEITFTNRYLSKIEDTDPTDIISLPPSLDYERYLQGRIRTGEWVYSTDNEITYRMMKSEAGQSRHVKQTHPIYRDVDRGYLQVSCLQSKPVPGRRYRRSDLSAYHSPNCQRSQVPSTLQIARDQSHRQQIGNGELSS